MAKKSERISKKQQAQQARSEAQRMQRMRMIGIVALVSVAFLGLMAWRNLGRDSIDTIIAEVGANLDGSAEAPVRIIEYGDFGCHSCRAWHNAGTKAALKAIYGDQISFEFRHFPVITRQSPKAAEASQCAAEQDAFWPFHDHIYENTSEGALSIDQLKSYADAIGLDRAAFDSCLDSGQYQSYVAEHLNAARDAGARGTPTFIIDGEQIFATFNGMTEAIDRELNS